MEISQYIINYFNQIKKLYGNFWLGQNGEKEYYLKLDGYYFCNRKQCTVVVIRIRNKRTAETLPVLALVNNKEYLQEIHPFDAFIIGVLSNNERNGMIDTNCVGLKNMNRTSDYYCNIKYSPVLEIVATYYNEKNIKTTVLKSTFLNKQIEVSADELHENHYWIHFIDSLQAVRVGYDASEAIIRNKG